jgi:hypothetical protein
MWVGQVSKLTGMLWLSLSIGLVAVGILLRPSAPAVVEIMPTPTLPRPAVWYSATAVPTAVPTVEPTPTPRTVEHVVQAGESFWVIVHDLCQPPIDIDHEVALVNYNLTLNSVFADTTIRPAEVLQIQCVLP